jgi:hypothetical protein
MKLKTLLLVTAVLCSGIASKAQVTAKVGPELGFGLNSMIVSDKYNDDVYGGGFAQIGGTGDIQFGRWFALRPSLMFNFNFNQYNYGFNDFYDRINTTNIYLPVDALATFHLRNGSKLFAGFGPYLSYTVGGKYKYRNYDVSGYPEEDSRSLRLGEGTDKDLKPLDLGLNFKMGFQMRNNLFMNCSFNLGITDRAPHNIDNYKIKDQQLFAFGIGYLFGPKEPAANSRHGHSHSSSRRR